MSPERWELIGRLFDEARDLAPPERTSYLEEACHGDADLRREVESLFAAEAYAGNFIANPAFEDGAPLMTTSRGGEKSGTPPRERIGSQLGPYQIYEFIGAGGMGEVFAAADTRLGRKVALKLLSASLRRDDDRLQRFIQEARTASLLNHPNILTIHDFGEHDGAPYIVSELLEGETLRELMRQGRLPVGRVVEIGIQIARGLAVAHDRGIVHRDLKPENLFLTTDGRVKVLDFGLAKLMEPAPGDRVHDVAEALIRTDPGMIMGTVSYMAPEQLRGEVTDQRTDIFALGIILFEMMTGVRPFGGTSTADTIGAILRAEPPLPGQPETPVRPEVPRAGLASGLAGGLETSGLERIVRRCLEKGMAQRFQTMNDLIFALEGIAQAAARPAIPPPHAERRVRARIKLPEWSGWLVAAIFMIATIVLGILLLRRPAGEARVVPFTSFPGQKSRPVFAPDGNQIAFYWEGTDGREPGIYVKLIDSDTPLRVHPLEIGSLPSLAWSPDGRLLAFNRRGVNSGIFTIPALGGPERKLTDLTGDFDWSPDGETLAIVTRETPDATAQIVLLTIESGARRLLTAPPAGYHGDRAPAWSPDGRSIAFMRSPNYLVSDIYQIALGDGTPTRLTFDNLELPGSLEWTVDGREILFTSTRGGLPGLWRVAASGGRLRREPGIGEYAYDPSVARRGDRLAYLYRRIDRNIWRTAGPHGAPGVAGGGNERETGPVKVIASTREEVNPQVSPDGRRIAFVSDRSGSREIWVSSSLGDDAVQLTSFDGSNTGAPRWSPDGRQIAFDSRFEGRTDIFIVNADGGRPWRLTSDGFEDVLPSWSRDGRSIYFASKRSGDWQVWKMAVTGGQPVQVTTGGGFEAFESADGQYIYYSQRDGSIDPGIWRVPAGGGEEQRVLDRGMWGYWALTDDGVCLIDSGHSSGPVIEFFNFTTREFSVLTRLDRSRAPSGPLAISVSSDGRWIYYWQADQIDSDVMLVENFR